MSEVIGTFGGQPIYEAEPALVEAMEAADAGAVLLPIAPYIPAAEWVRKWRESQAAESEGESC